MEKLRHAFSFVCPCGPLSSFLMPPDQSTSTKFKAKRPRRRFFSPPTIVEHFLPYGSQTPDHAKETSLDVFFSIRYVTNSTRNSIELEHIFSPSLAFFPRKFQSNTHSPRGFYLFPDHANLRSETPEKRFFSSIWKRVYSYFPMGS